jgi:hypothetical protein
MAESEAGRSSLSGPLLYCTSGAGIIKRVEAPNGDWRSDVKSRRLITSSGSMCPAGINRKAANKLTTSYNYKL